MLTIPVYNPAGEQIGEETIDPADFGGEINKQLLHDVVLMHLAARRVGTVNTRGRADVAGSGKKLFRQKGTGNARAGSKRTNKRKGGGVAFARRNRDYRYAMPKKAVRTRSAWPSSPSSRTVRPSCSTAWLSTSPGPRRSPRPSCAIRRPDLSEAEATEAVGETKAHARRRTLERRSVLLGLPAHNPVVHRSARNIEGVKVAPVAEFNTYDILKQRYLVLTREALATSRNRSSRSRPGAPLPARPPLPRRAEPWSLCVARPKSNGSGPGAGAVPGRAAAPDHREGHPPLGTA